MKAAGIKMAQFFSLKEFSQNPPPSFFDKVVIDAPCSGSGTLRRKPALRLEIDHSKVEQLAEQQKEIINYYSRFVRRKGYLIYLTCSLFPAENQEIVSHFLKENSDFSPYPFAEHDVTASWWNHPLPLKKEQFMLTLSPHRHGTDGFFIALMKRN